MSEYSIPISFLNDFIFCPASIYFHQLEENSEKITYQGEAQLNGTAAHKTVDSAAYSTSSHILQGTHVYSEQYDLHGKIDIFNTVNGNLCERKKRVQRIYDGYIFQLYAQFFCLQDMGYTVKKLSIHSLDNNKTYNIPLPCDSPELFHRFCSLIQEIKNFSFISFQQTERSKCEHCIYEPLCSFSVIKEDV